MTRAIVDEPTAGNPSFMEQMQRIWACYGDVRRHEKRHGVRYDFITKIRSDLTGRPTT